MRVRGYRLSFGGSAEAHGGPTATLYAIRGDGTVPGVVYEIDPAGLFALDEAFGARGYERAQIHVEAITAGRGGPTVPATAYVFPRDSALTTDAPSDRYVTSLRGAWEANGLDPAAINYALENP